MALFWHTRSYYARSPPTSNWAAPRPAAPARQHRRRPHLDVNLLTQQALSAALSLGHKVVAVAVAGTSRRAS